MVEQRIGERMVGRTKEMPSESELRQIAEKMVGMDRGKTELSHISPEEMATQLHELQVHQIELKMQNDELRRIQDELETSRDRYAHLYDFAPNGYFTVTEKGIINEANLTLAAMLGVIRTDLLGQPFSRFVLKEDQDIFYNHWNRLMETETTQSCKLRLIKKEGDGIYVRLECILLKQGNDFQQVRASVSDITELVQTEEKLRKLEEQLHKSQKMESIGTLAGGIAHDFNNILCPIIGFAELSIQDLPENHPVKENLEDILRGAKRARDLVRQILLFSRQKQVEYKPLQIQAEIEETLKLLRAVIPANIEIHKDLNQASDFIWGDPTEIHEIIMNLCTNAYHAMEETGGTLKISLNKVKPDSKLNLPSREYCCLSVCDTGPGISPEIMDNIFEPYFTTKKVGKGSGLGLAVIHGIVENSKGAITVKSNPGKGTTFYVYLPLTSQALESGGMTGLDKSGMGGGETILLVDDEEPIVKLGVRMLERSGYTVIGKTSCIEALALFLSEPDKFDLVITDMAMPSMTGTEFAKKLMEIRPDIPIIICTGFSERLDHEAAKAVGIMDYLHKPILMNELSSKVREVLDHAKKDKNTHNR